MPHRHTPSSRRQDEILLSDVSCGGKMTQGPQILSSTPAPLGQASCGCQMCKGRKSAPGLSKHLCSLVIGYIFQELDTTHEKSIVPSPSRLPAFLLSQPPRFRGVLRRQHGSQGQMMHPEETGPAGTCACGLSLWSRHLAQPEKLSHL